MHSHAVGTRTYAGREDSQVKVNGFRIELGEINNVLGRVSGVDTAASKVFGNRIVAYVVPSTACSAEELRQSLRREARAQLPSYMVPKAIMVVERFPLDHNGKVPRLLLITITLVSL